MHETWSLIKINQLPSLCVQLSFAPILQWPSLFELQWLWVPVPWKANRWEYQDPSRPSFSHSAEAFSLPSPFFGCALSPSVSPCISSSTKSSYSYSLQRNNFTTILKINKQLKSLHTTGIKEQGKGFSYSCSSSPFCVVYRHRREEMGMIITSDERTERRS